MLNRGYIATFVQQANAHTFSGIQTPRALLTPRHLLIQSDPCFASAGNKITEQKFE